MTATALLLSTGGAAGANPTFATPVVVTDLNDSEPGIDVATDGTIYVNAIPGLSIPGPSPSHLFRSTDGGATWVNTPPGLRALMPGGGDFDVDVDKVTGTLYTSDLWLGSSTVASSTNKGASWTSNPISTLIQDRQWIATAGNGRVYHVTHQLPTGVTVARSLDGGVTFPVQSLAMHILDRTGCICPPGNMVVEGGTDALTDKVGVIAYTSTGGIIFARSTNGGTTFAVRSVQAGQSGVQTMGAFPVVADAGGGKLVAVWQEMLGNSSRVKMSRSTDWGNTWSAGSVIVSTGTSVFPWVAARGNKIGVSLFHTTASGIPDTVANTALWYEKYLESADFGNTWSSLVTVDPVAVKTGPICTDGLNCRADRELGDFQSLTMDSSGRAYLTWTRSIDGVRDTQIRFARQS